MERAVLHLGWIALAYLLGSFPFGMFVGKVLCGIDPQQAGSRNTGATNVARLCGARWGALALGLDLLKGLLPVLTAKAFSHNSLFLSAVAMAAVIGHDYSCFLGGRGGKGVATTIGVSLGLGAAPAFTAVLLGAAAIKLTGFVSVGSLAIGALLPLTFLASGRAAYVPVTLALALLLFWKHRDNIQRLAQGQENPWKKTS